MKQRRIKMKYKGKECYKVESSLQRVQRHLSRGFFIVSADRYHMTEEEKANKQQELVDTLRSKDVNLGYIPLYGGYIENQGLENETWVSEVSFFVPRPDYYDNEAFLDIALRLLNDYDQDAILYADPSESIFSIDRWGEVVEIGRGLTLRNVELFYSALKKGPHRNIKFRLEGIIMPTHSVMNFYAERALGHLGVKNK